MSKGERPIIIRRPRKVTVAHHGGSWKIAYADFMTAMMALFLVLWILSSATPQQLRSVAEYFRTPLSVALAGGDKQMSSTSAIPGGGPDPTHIDGEKERIEMRLESRATDVQRQFVALQKRIESVVTADPQLRELSNQIRFDMTPYGLRIQLVDTEQRPMFETGSDQVAPYMRDLLRALAPLLNEMPNRLSISGHTDSVPYAAGVSGYSNWELSADRANASRRELVMGGFDNGKLLRVTGMGDQLPAPGSDPGDPVNRRITLVVLNREAAQLIRDRVGASLGLGELATSR
ncbi:flagellar motor protein MotB [Parahaliea mediterranea]|uniref:Flagellar motor protein MotB n=1 Tax=Parahaliea mediterranea TaxID=651086 RepID=A0A939ILB8_9GAMM|nr:flagellar motor protein MotB [Parahaliea mediterranea]MBN7795813.1 flagellar motor protein MotB [Parahaliea mediterranea]